MNRYRTSALAIFFMLLGTISAMAETVTLTLDDAVKRALDQSLNLKKEAIDLARTEYSANRLWSEIFPGFSLSAGLNFLPSTPLITEPGFQYKDENLEYSLNLGLSLSLNPSLRSSMKRIDLAYRSQLLKYEDARKQLEVVVIKDFLYLITRKENIAYMEESLELALQKLDKDRIARENGLLSELTWLNTRLSVETARYNLSNAQEVYQTALGDFLALLGMETTDNVIFKGTVEIVPVLSDPEQLIMEHLPKRPDIINQRQIIEGLELAKNITTLNNRFPTLDIGTQWRGLQGGVSFNGPFSDNVSGSVTLRIPLDSWIPGTKQNQNIRAARDEVEKARISLQNTETSAKSQIRSLVSRLTRTWASLEIARLRVEIAERTAESAEEGFKNGTVEFQELEDTRNELTDARQRLLQGEYDYQSLILDLASAINVEWKTLTGKQTSNASGSINDTSSNIR